MPIEIILANVTNTRTIIDGLTLSDLTAIISSIIAFAALISSALIFYFGYSRTRKSEQIKIAREALDRIDLKSRTLNLNNGPFKERILSMGDLVSEIEYFGYLLRIREIRDENILKYCIPRIKGEFIWIESYFNEERLGPKTETDADADEFKSRINKTKDQMKALLDEYGTSTVIILPKGGVD